MKTTRKLLSMVMAMVLLAAMAVCMPAMAVETTYTAGVNPTFEMEGLSYTVTAGSVTVTDAAAFEGDTNTTQKIRIKHSEDATTTVRVDLSSEGLERGKVEITSNFVITDFVSAAEDGFTMIKERTGETNKKTAEAGVFTKKTDWWRTAMLTDDSIMDMTVTLTFTGVGTVFIDDTCLTTNRGLSNGDFRGLVDEYQPAMWSFSGAIIKDETDAETVGWRLHQTKEENYLTAKGLGRSRGIYQDISSSHMVSGALYRVTLATMGDYTGFKTSSGNNIFPLGDQKNATWTGKNASWSDVSMTYKANNYPDGLQTSDFRISIAPQNATGYMKNIRLEKLEENCVVTDADGRATEKISAGTYTVNYMSPLSDISEITYIGNEDFDSAIKTKRADVHEKTSSTKLRALVAVYEENKNGKCLYEVKLSDEIASKMCIPSGTSATESAIGIIPATADPISVEIPDNGKKYSIKVMSWSSLSGLAPHSSGFDFPAAE